MTSKIDLGSGGVKMSCRTCGTDFEKDDKTGNLVCPNADCPAPGGISSSGGISLTVDEHGNTTIKSR